MKAYEFAKTPVCCIAPTGFSFRRPAGENAPGQAADDVVRFGNYYPQAAVDFDKYTNRP